MPIKKRKRSLLLMLLFAIGGAIPVRAEAQYLPESRFPRMEAVDLPSAGPGDPYGILHLYRLADCSQPRMRQAGIAALGGAAFVWILTGVGVLLGAELDGELAGRAARASAITGGVLGVSVFLIHSLKCQGGEAASP